MLRQYRLVWIPALLGAVPGIAQQLPDGPGKDATVQVCSTCHDVDVIFGYRQGREEWSGTIQKMIASGAQGTPQQFSAVLDYLVRNFGPGVKPVMVNRASAAELESGLGLTAGEAAAIVKYRTDHGPFKTVDDLKKVAGVDAQKIESKKDRLAFATAVVAQAPAAGQVAPAGPAAGRGGRGGQGGGGGRGGGARRGGFTQFTRPLASQDVLARGQGLYETNCASCHASDMRGTEKGTRLLRSLTALNDQHGELVGKAIAEHNPKIILNQNDSVAVAEYIHSILATTGGQGSPPGRNPAGIKLEILVGDAKAGERYFDKVCARCHSTANDLKGLASKYPDPRALQNAWVAGAAAANPFGGGRGGGGVGNPVTVTMADGSKLEGKLVRRDDFLVILTLPDGTRRSIARHDGIPKVEVKDPNEAHKKMVLELDDPENKNLHDVTAYLATLK